MRALLAIVLGFTVSAADASERCPMKMLVRKDGVIVLDGKSYTDKAQLGRRLRAIKSRCPIDFSVEKEAGYDTIARALVIVQPTGTTKIGFAGAPPERP